MNNLRDEFLLEPGLIFLNHGSFGATPRRVFESYQRWQLQLERQPVRFFSADHDELMGHSRAVLGEYLGAHPGDLVLVQNATQGVNIVGRSLHLRPGDEILASNHEYGACEYMWEFLCGKTGASYVRRKIGLPAEDPHRVADSFWAGVTPRTRVIFLSHITSATALRLPVEDICRRAREAGILTLIDGAHAPGQLPLDLVAIGADFYTGNCHKWMLSPKGAGFLYARPEVQGLIEPLVVSWGYHPNGTPSLGSQFLDYLQWTGTRDPAAALAVPEAIRFMDDHNWDEVRAECQLLARQAIIRIGDLTGLPPAYGPQSINFAQMAVAPLPAAADLAKLKVGLLDEFSVEVPLMEWEGQKFIRVSIQAYNDQQDVDTLLTALKTLFARIAG